MQAIYVCFLNFILASKRCKMIWKEFDTMAYINYNYAVLKMKSSLLFIIIVLSWRLAKQFLAQIFSIRKTKKVSHYPLKLPSQDVTGEIRINLLSAWQKFVFRWIKYEITVEMKSILRNEKEVSFVWFVKRVFPKRTSKPRSNRWYIYIYMNIYIYIYIYYNIYILHRSHGCSSMSLFVGFDNFIFNEFLCGFS